MNEPSGEHSIEANHPGPRSRLLRSHPWIVFVLPLVVFLVVGLFEPKPSEPNSSEAAGGFLDLGISYEYYPVLYSVKIALTLAAILFVLPGYRRFPLKISPLALVVGVVGVVVWVGIYKLDLEQKLGLHWLLGLGQRSAFNPLEELKDTPAWAYGFLAIRLFGLAVVIAVVEEFFLRGFLMRFVIEPEWTHVPFGQVNSLAIVVGTAIPMLMHPAELFAAMVWFSMVTWLMMRTKNIWDCVAAHAVTNLLLGIYVITSGGEAWKML